MSNGYSRLFVGIFTSGVTIRFVVPSLAALTNSTLSYMYKIPATVAQHVAHPLVVGKVIGSNLGPTPRHN